MTSFSLFYRQPLLPAVLQVASLPGAINLIFIFKLIFLHSILRYYITLIQQIKCNFNFLSHHNLSLLIKIFSHFNLLYF